MRVRLGSTIRSDSLSYVGLVNLWKALAFALTGTTVVNDLRPLIVEAEWHDKKRR